MEFSVLFKAFATTFAGIIRTWPLLLITGATDVTGLTMTL